MTILYGFKVGPRFFFDADKYLSPYIKVGFLALNYWEEDYDDDLSTGLGNEQDQLNDDETYQWSGGGVFVEPGVLIHLSRYVDMKIAYSYDSADLEHYKDNLSHRSYDYSYRANSFTISTHARF